MFKYLGKLLSWKSQGPKDLLCRICLVSAISSSLFTNDTTCVVLTEFVLKIAKQNNVKSHPFLLALASSANIGSAATPIGNPQNLLIAIRGNISFGEFVLTILPAMLVGVVVNVLILLVLYWKVLCVKKDEEVVIFEEEVTSHRFSPATMSHSVSMTNVFNSNGSMMMVDIDNLEEANQVVVQQAMEVEEEERGLGKEKGDWKRKLRKLSVYVVTNGMLIAFLLGLNMSWTALTAALVLVVLDFKDARPSLEKVSYPLLIFFCGMFITVDGFNRTGVPTTLWNLTEPHARINHLSGIALLSLVILFLSNLASNVPTVLLLGVRVAASAATISLSEEKKAWLILAWVSTVAGNLSLLGSAANLIVCEQAHRSQFRGNGDTLSFWRHLKFGVPSTLVVTAIGLTLIKG